MAFILLFVIYFMGVGLKLYAMYDPMRRDFSDFFSVVVKIAAVVLIGLSLVYFLFIYGSIDSYMAKVNVTRESLIYQLENDIYDNVTDNGKKELISEIQDWNEDLAWYREMQDNFWFGIYIPNIYNQIEPIPLEKGVFTDDTSES